jgi:hypothetical protein
MTIQTVLQAHFSRYPAMQIEDMYKLIHQAALGSEHAVANAESARNWLLNELTAMGTGTDEPLIDPLSDETGIVRIHLRPFIALGGDPETLLSAFIRTANEFSGDVQTLQNYWNIAYGLGRFSPRELDGFIQSMQEKSFPAVHHTLEYERLCHPAYRVVARQFWT